MPDQLSRLRSDPSLNLARTRNHHVGHGPHHGLGTQTAGLEPQVAPPTDRGLTRKFPSEPPHQPLR